MYFFFFLSTSAKESPWRRAWQNSRILRWRIPWTEEPGGLQSMGSQRVGHNWSNLAHTSTQQKILKKKKKGTLEFDLGIKSVSVLLCVSLSHTHTHTQTPHPQWFHFTCMTLTQFSFLSASLNLVQVPEWERAESPEIKYNSSNPSINHKDLVVH